MYRITLKQPGVCIVTAIIHNDWENQIVFYAVDKDRLEKKETWVCMRDVLYIEFDEKK